MSLKGVLTVLFSGERISVLQVVGTAFVFAGTLLAQRKEAAERR